MRNGAVPARTFNLITDKVQVDATGLDGTLHKSGISRTMLVFVLVIVIAIGAGGAYYHLASSSSHPARAGSTTLPGGAVAVIVGMKGSAGGGNFIPSTITVVVGVNNMVIWINDDGTPHTVTANDGSFGSTLGAGANYTRAFTTAGTYQYHCTIHSWMQATVVVKTR